MPTNSDYQTISTDNSRWANYPEKITLLVVFIITAVFNALANQGKFGKSISFLSLKYHTLLTPYSYAFNIWIGIYFFWAAFVLVQLLPNKYLTNASALYSKSRYGKFRINL